MGNHSVASTSLKTGTDVGFVMLILSWILLQRQDREKAGRTDMASCSFSLEAVQKLGLWLGEGDSPAVAYV